MRLLYFLVSLVIIIRLLDEIVWFILIFQSTFDEVFLFFLLLINFFRFSGHSPGSVNLIFGSLGQCLEP
jgi:hypothetical protein